MEKTNNDISGQRNYEKRAEKAYYARFGEDRGTVSLCEHKNIAGIDYVELKNNRGQVLATYRIDHRGRLAYRKTLLPGSHGLLVEEVLQHFQKKRAKGPKKWQNDDEYDLTFADFEEKVDSLPLSGLGKDIIPSFEEQIVRKYAHSFITGGYREGLLTAIDAVNESGYTPPPAMVKVIKDEVAKLDEKFGEQYSPSHIFSIIMAKKTFLREALLHFFMDKGINTEPPSGYVVDKDVIFFMETTKHEHPRSHLSKKHVLAAYQFERTNISDPEDIECCYLWRFRPYNSHGIMAAG